MPGTPIIRQRNLHGFSPYEGRIRGRAWGCGSSRELDQFDVLYVRRLVKKVRAGRAGHRDLLPGAAGLVSIDLPPGRAIFMLCAERDGGGPMPPNSEVEP